MKHLITATLLLLYIITLTGCFTGNSHRRGKLSDAMQKASSTNTGSRKVNATYQPSSSSDDDEEEEEERERYYEIQRLKQEAELARLRAAEIERSKRSTISIPENQPQPIVEAPPSLSHSSTGLSSGNLTPAPIELADTTTHPLIVNNPTFRPLPQPVGEQTKSVFGFRGGSGTLFLGNSYGINYGELMIGGKKKIGTSSFIFGFGYSPLQQIDKTEFHNVEFENSLSGGVFMLGAGWDGHLNPEWKLGFLCPYLILGFKADLMFWDYKNNIQAPVFDEEGNETGTETISSDCMLGIEAYTGVGINLVHTDQIELGLEIMPGGIVWLPGTFQGFDNDVFDAFKYTKIGLQVKFSH